MAIRAIKHNISVKIRIYLNLKLQTVASKNNLGEKFFIGILNSYLSIVVICNIKPDFLNIVYDCVQYVCRVKIYPYNIIG